MPVQTGQKAPAFTLPDTERKQRSLTEFLGKKVVLAFFPGAFTGVCTKEMCSFRDSLASFENINAQVIAISVDAPAANKGFAQANHLTFPILSDYLRDVSSQYCGLVQDFGGLKGLTVANRAVFVIDPGGTVRYAWISENPGTEPPYDDINKALHGIS